MLAGSGCCLRDNSRNESLGVVDCRSSGEEELSKDDAGESGPRQRVWHLEDAECSQCNQEQHAHGSVVAGKQPVPVEVVNTLCSLLLLIDAVPERVLFMGAIWQW